MCVCACKRAAGGSHGAQEVGLWLARVARRLMQRGWMSKPCNIVMSGARSPSHTSSATLRPVAASPLRTYSSTSRPSSSFSPCHPDKAPRHEEARSHDRLACTSASSPCTKGGASCKAAAARGEAERLSVPA